jgi:hypothetical protein
MLVLTVEFAINLTGGFVFALLLLKALVVLYLPSLLLFIPTIILFKHVKIAIRKRSEANEGLWVCALNKSINC